MRRLIFAALTFLCAAPAWAEPRDIVVGVEELEYYPLYALRDGEYVGAAREILDAFSQAKGYRPVYRPQPIKRLYAELTGGTIDLKFPDNSGWAADLKQGVKVAYSKPVIAFIDGVVVRPINLGRGADAVKTLGTVSGFTPFSWLDRIKAGKTELKENPRLELLLKQTVVGRVDGAYVSIAVAEYALGARLDMPGSLIFDPALPHSKDFYHASSVKNPALVAEFDAWLAENAQLVQTIKDRLNAEPKLK